jgi:hypothetical protein
MALTRSKPASIFTPEGNSLAVFIDVADGTLKLKDVFGDVELFSTLAGGAGLKLKDDALMTATLTEVVDKDNTPSILSISTESVGIGTNTSTGLLNLFKPSDTVRLMINGDAGQFKIITFRTGGLQRFGLYVNNTAESGANAGSDFAIRAYSDAGTLLSTALFIKRSTGNIGINTTTPAKLLDVNGDALVNGLTIGRGTGNIDSNTALGKNALNVNTTGSSNTAVGQQALLSNTIGASNVGIGFSALLANTEGASNIGVGTNALNANATGNFNTVVGTQSAIGITTGSNNVVFGTFAIPTLNGSNNTILGYNTGQGITTGSNNTILGANVTGLSPTLANNVILADGSGNQRVVVDASGNVGLNNGTSTTQATSVIRSLGTNSGIALVPNGTGAITADIPDGTATGGNARGINAVDLQSVRTLNTEVVSGAYSAILGGRNNSVGISDSCIVGGNGNLLNKPTSFIGGGQGNVMASTFGSHCVIGGGQGNSMASRTHAVIGGGQNNASNGNYSTISGGFGNSTNDSTYNTVGGGSTNIADNGASTVSGGLSNRALSAYATISGGQSNTASTGTHATVVGGASNVSSGQHSVTGGVFCVASGNQSFAIGQSNTASGGQSVSLGWDNVSSASFSFSQGRNALAYLQGQSSIASGSFDLSKGPAQASSLIARKEASLTTAATTILSLDGTGTTNLIIPNGNNRMWNVKVSTIAVVQSITGTATGVTVGDSFMENRNLLFKKVAGTSSIVGVGTAEIISDTSMLSALMTYTAGASQELALTFNAPTFGGLGSLTMRIVSKVELVEVWY